MGKCRSFAAITVLLILQTSSAIAAVANGFVYPVGDQSSGSGYTITQGYKNSAGHTGVDLANGASGGTIRAIANGNVVDKQESTSTASWGYMLRIEHLLPDGSKVYSQYGHMLAGSLQFNKGDSVDIGQPIGKVGNTGNSTGNHLHFEIKKINYSGCGYIPGTNCGGTVSDVWSNYYDPLKFVADNAVTTSPSKPDLVVKEVNLSKTTLAPGESFRIDPRIKNDGGADVNSSFKIKYLLSSGTGIDSSPTSLAEDSISSLGKGSSAWEDATVSAPTNPGTYNITVRADSSKDIDESNEGNNYFDPPVVITVANTNALPEGNFDAVDCASVRGWTQDPDTTNSINVHIYADGPSGSGTYVGQVVADVNRSDLPFADKNHGFGFTLPLSLKDGRDHSIYVYAIDSAGGTNPLLNGSPRNIKCINPAIMMIITDLILNSDDSKPVISVLPSSLDLGNVNIGQSSSPQMITVKNAGDATLSIGTLSIGSAAFTLQDDLCSGKTLAVAATCTTQVIFTPSQTGQKDEKITLPSNDPVNPSAYVALMGNGAVVIPTPPSNIIAKPANNAVGLTWNASNETVLSGYRIYYGNSPGNYGTPLLTGKVSAFTVTGLTNGSTYYFAISAINTVGAESAKSLEVSGIPILNLTDTTAPSVTSFALPSTASSLTVTVSVFSATDNIAVSGYILSESTTTPQAADPGWTSTPPAVHTFSTVGSKTLSAFAKDAAGNISQPANASVTITLSAINGACGSSDGQTQGTAPTTNICTAGTASTVTGTGPWSWTCTGLNGGTNASCTAAVQTWTITTSANTGGDITPSGAVSVVHGGSQSFTVDARSGYTISSLTVDGNPLALITIYPLLHTGHTFTNVTANHTIAATFSPITIKVDGLCGSADKGTFSVAPVANLCTAGTASTVTGSGPWNWTCTGSGGSTASCSAGITTVLDTTVPVISVFTLPTASATLTIPVSSLTGSDNVGITGWCLAQTNSATNCTWSATKPTAHTFSGGSGQRILYAFAKDAAGNVSNPVSAGINIALGDIGGGAAQNGGLPSIADALNALRISVGAKTPTAAELARADVAPIVNGVPQPDGKVDIHDVIVILRRVVGLPL